MSKPIIATNVGRTEAVIHRKTGYLAWAADRNSIADTIMKLVSNGNFRIQFGKAGRKYVKEEFTL